VKASESVLNAMAYIIVRTLSNPGTDELLGGATFIECDLQTSQQYIEATMESLSAETIYYESSCLYKIALPPRVVLRKLKSHGFKVVASNSLPDVEGEHWQIWTLDV